MIGQFGSPFILAASRFRTTTHPVGALTPAGQPLLEGFFTRGLLTPFGRSLV